MKKVLYLLGVAALSAGLASCSGGGGSTPPLALSPQTVTAARGLAASLGDSIALGQDVTSVQAYPTLLALDINASVANLGIGGEEIGTRGVSKGVQIDEVPLIPLNTTVVTLYIGTNDALDQQTAGTYDPSMFVANIPPLISAIKLRVPAAQIIVATIPNRADTEPYLTGDPTNRARETTMINAMNAALVGTGLAIADLHCDPAMYDPINFFSPYDVHPVASGHVAIAADFMQAIQHPKPVQPCAYDAALNG